MFVFYIQIVFSMVEAVLIIDSLRIWTMTPPKATFYDFFFFFLKGPIPSFISRLQLKEGLQRRNNKVHFPEESGEGE